MLGFSVHQKPSYSSFSKLGLVETGPQCISKVLLFLGLSVHKNRFCQFNSVTASLLKNQNYQC